MIPQRESASAPPEAAGCTRQAVSGPARWLMLHVRTKAWQGGPREGKCFRRGMPRWPPQRLQCVRSKPFPGRRVVTHVCTKIPPCCVQSQTETRKGRRAREGGKGRQKESGRKGKAAVGLDGNQSATSRERGAARGRQTGLWIPGWDKINGYLQTGGGPAADRRREEAGEGESQTQHTVAPV